MREQRERGPSSILLVSLTIIGTLALHIVMPSLPDMARDFDVGVSEVQAVVSVYLYGLAFGQLIYGPLSDKLGRRPVLLVGLTIFFCASIVAAATTSIHVMLAARGFQALGGCSGFVLGRAMVRDGGSDSEAAGRLATLAMAATLAPAMSPAVGGLIGQMLGWRAIFLGLAILSVILAVVAFKWLPETNSVRNRDAGFTSLLKSHRNLLKHREFRTYAIAGACATAPIYPLLSATPLLFGINLKLSTAEVGGIYLVILLFLSLGSFLARLVRNRWTILQAARIGSAMTFFSSLSLLGVLLFMPFSMKTLIPLIGFTLGMGLTSPNALAGAMNSDPTGIGAAASLYGFLQMALGGVLISLAGLWPDGSGITVAVAAVMTTMVGSAALYLGTRAS